jgi:phosphoribosylformylglycinamidine cyclo-ligase
VLGLALDARPPELGGQTIGAALLAEHRSYYKLLWPLLEQGRIAALAHITGGGLVDNLPRVLGACDARIDRASWEVPPLFALLCRAGSVDPEEAYQVFNMGVGMVLIADPGEVAAIEAHLRAQGEEPLRIGRTEPARGPEPAVRWSTAP